MEQRNLFKIVLTCILIIAFLVAGQQAFGRKHHRKGYLGVCIEDLSKEEKDELQVRHGVLVIEVIEESPAEECGIQEDDVIQYLDNKKIRRTRDLKRIVGKLEPKTEVKIQLVREGQNKELTVQIGKLRSHNTCQFWNDGSRMIFSQKGSGYLGVRLQALSGDLAGYFGVKKDAGALILEVEEDSPAEKAELKSGDVIVRIDDEPVSDPEDVQDFISDLEDGDKVDLHIIRKEKPMQITAEVEGRAWFFQWQGDHGCGRKGLHNFRIDLPHFQIDIPEIDVDVEIDEDLEEEIEKSLEGLERTIRIRQI